MVKTIIGVIVGYIVMSIFLFAAFTCLYLVLGPEGAFKPATFDTSTTWVIGGFILGFIGTIIGGFTAALIAKNNKAAFYFGILVLVVSLGVSIVALQVGNPHEVRAGDIPNLEAMQKAQLPTWFNFVYPFTGLLGAIVGGRLRKKS